MARPSQKKERTDQILDALETCLARHGLQGATQERIAEEAGLARPLVRHNVGNREAMLRLGLERFMARSNQELEQFFVALPADARAETLVEWLFDPRSQETASVRVLEAFGHWAQDDPEVGKQIIAWTDRFIDSLAAELGRCCPDASEAACDEVATAIAALYVQLASLAPLGRLKGLRERSIASGKRLVRSLF